MTIRPTAAELDRIGEALGSQIVRASAPGDGDSRATFRLSLADGRSVGARWRPRAAPSADGAVREVSALERVRAAGVQAPEPIAIVPVADRTWLVRTWLAGRVGRELLADPSASESLARAMGALVGVLARVETAATERSSPWATRSGFAAAGATWLAAVRERLTARTAGRLEDAIEATAADPRWAAAATFAHGDYAPVNAIVAPSGEVGLVDLEHAAASPLAIDVAWWSWVVAHHHPAVWARIGPAFVQSAAESDDPTARQARRDLQLAVLAQRAADASVRDERGRWLDRIADTVARGAS